MALIPFLLEPKFNINPLQQTFRLPPLRSFPINLSSSANNNAFKLNYYSVIRYSPKLKTKCFSMSPIPKGENGIGGIGDPEDNDMKAISISSGIHEVIWRSITMALIALQKSVVTGVLLGSLLLYDHQRRCVALAASGGRMGGSSFSSSSSKSSKSSSSTSSSRSSSLSSSSSSKSPSSSSSSSSRSPSYSSSSCPSKTRSYSSSSSSSSKRPSYSSSSSSYKTPSYSSSSSYSSSRSTSSSESPSYYSSRSRSSSSYTRPKPSFSSYQSSEDDGSAVGVAPAVEVKPAFGAGPLIACAMIGLALFLDPEIQSRTLHVFSEFLSRTLFAKKTSVLKLQVGLSGTVRSMQRDLNRIAETADTSTPQGLHYILQETTRALLRYSDSCISGYSSVDAKTSILEVEKLFNQLCIEERGKFDEETLVNVNNIRKQSATTQKPNDVRNEYIVITIVVAADGVHKLPPINSSAKLKEALQKLTTIPSSGVKAVEVLWTPQNENDILTEQEYLEDYSLLRPL